MGPKRPGFGAAVFPLIGTGIPAAGNAGQVLAKATGADYNTTWQDNSFANLSGLPGDNANMASALAAKQGVLGFTPENTANKGQPNGYPALDSTGKVPSAQLPSYVDDIQEFATLSAFPRSRCVRHPLHRPGYQL